MHSEAAKQDRFIESLNKSLSQLRKQLRETEVKLAQQASEMKDYETKLETIQKEKLQMKEEQAANDELIKTLDEARRKSVKEIQELKKPKPESNRRKAFRRYQNLKQDEFISGLDGYMEPFVLNVSQAQAQYDMARKNLRMATARERLVRPRT